MLGNFSWICSFQKIISGLSSECQTVWIQIRPYILWSLIWVQTVCKKYQITEAPPAGKELTKRYIVLIYPLNVSSSKIKCNCICYLTVSHKIKFENSMKNLTCEHFLQNTCIPSNLYELYVVLTAFIADINCV